MDLAAILDAKRTEILQHATGALGRAHLQHYELSGSESSRHRLDDLFDVVATSLKERTLEPICRYSQTIAQERFDTGFTIGEVQTAFNVLEESIWQVVIPHLPPSDLAEATGLIGTVLGAGKDALARAWVSQATSEHVPSLDLAALFQGAAG